MSSRFLFLMRPIKRQVNKALIVINLLSFCFFAFNVEAKEINKINEKYEFNIPVQSLSSSLNELSDIAKISFLFPYDLVVNKTGSSVKGRYTVQQALSVLLNNSGLEGELSDKKAFLIKALSPNTNNNENIGEKQVKTQKTILATLLSVLFSTTSGAAEAKKQLIDNEAAEIEVITVSGIRGSLKKSMNDKRFSTEIMDSISAEDIGQLPDENIAEALQRVTGIQMSRSADGEGSTIQIRGVSNNNVEVNGQTLSGTSADRSINFQDIPSELVSGIEIQKAPTADRIEGSLGGTVNLKTRRPLGIKEDKVASITTKAKYSELSGDTDPDVSFLIGKNWRETKFGDFGVIVNAGAKTVSSLTEAYGGGDFETATGAWFLQSGDMPAKKPFNKGDHVAGDLDVNGDGIADANDKFYVPNAFRLFSSERESERNSINASLQWQPNENINFFFDATLSDSEEKLKNSRYNIQFNKGLALPLNSGDNQFQSLGNTPNGEHFLMTSGRLGGANVKLGSAPSAKTTWRESELFTLGGDIQITDNLNVSAELSTSKAKSWTNQAALTMGYDWNLDGKIKDWGGIVDFDYNSVDLVDFTLYESPSNTGNPETLKAIDPTDINYERLAYEKYQRNADDIHNSSDAFRLDATYEFDGIITQISAGLRVSERSYENQSFSHIDKSVAKVPVNPDNTNNEAHKATSEAFQQCLTPVTESALSAQTGNMPRTWTSTGCNSDFFTEYFSLEDLRAIDPETGAGVFERAYERFDVLEETTAYYVRADYYTELFGKNFYGNFGVRYIDTTTTTQGFADINGDPQWVTVDGSYTELLPSLNANLDLNDEMILRLSYADVLSRPGLKHLSPGIKLYSNEDSQGYAGTGQAGNPDLAPILATNLDLSFEWYYQDASMFSAALFYKDIDSSIAYGPESVDMTFNDELYSVRQKQNIAGTKLEGVEFSLVQGLDFLPGFLKHTGVSANYTYTQEDSNNIDAEGEPIARRGLSEDSYNLVAFYDDNTFSVRLAYNWRSEFVRREYVLLGSGSADSLPEIEADRGQLDLTANYKINKNFKINFSAINLNESTTERYLKYEELTNYISDSGVRYNLGLVVRF